MLVMEETDPGNIGNGYREKNIALNVVKEIQAEELTKYTRWHKSRSSQEIKIF